MVATSGAQLLPQDAVKALREQLLPLSTILTPNIPEAKLLLSDAGQPVPEIATVDDLISVAKAVQALGPRYVLLKGGHLPLMRGKIVDASTAEKNVVTDVLYEEGETLTLETDYISSKNTHGTGCSLACSFSPSSVCFEGTMLITVDSRNRFKPRPWPRHSSRSPSRKVLCRSWHQDRT